MKTRKLLSLVFSLVLLISLVSCKKDDDKEPSKVGLITASEWKGFALWMNGEDITQYVLEADPPYDVRALSIKFDKAGTYLVTFNGRTDNGTWEFTNNQQSILLDKGTTHQQTVKVTKLTDSEFYYVETYDGDEFEFRTRR